MTPRICKIRIQLVNINHMTVSTLNPSISLVSHDYMTTIPPNLQNVTNSFTNWWFSARGQTSNISCMILRSQAARVRISRQTAMIFSKHMGSTLRVNKWRRQLHNIRWIFSTFSGSFKDTRSEKLQFVLAMPSKTLMRYCFTLPYYRRN